METLRKNTVPISECAQFSYRSSFTMQTLMRLNLVETTSGYCLAVDIAIRVRNNKVCYSKHLTDISYLVLEQAVTGVNPRDDPNGNGCIINGWSNDIRKDQASHS